jgi:hypothetical protein
MKINDNSEKGSLLPINNQEIHFKDLIIGNLLKRGRFSTIYQGLYNQKEIAIKMLTTNQLFEHEKNIYSLPFMNHFNILE